MELVISSVVRSAAHVSLKKLGQCAPFIPLAPHVQLKQLRMRDDITKKLSDWLRKTGNDSLRHLAEFSSTN